MLLAGFREVSSAGFRSAEFRRLKAKWDRRLKASGLEDIERPDGSLSDYPAQRWMMERSPAAIEAARDYFQRACEYLWEGKFTRLERRIWELHSRGESNRDIAARLGIHRSQVQRRLEKHKRLAGLSLP